MRGRIAVVFVLAAAVASAAEESKLANGATFDPTKAERTAEGGVSLSASAARASGGGASTMGTLLGLGDDDIFLDVGGVDKLRWGLVKAHMDAIAAPLPLPVQVGAEGMAEANDAAFGMRFKKVVKEYLKYAVFAAEARRLGLKVADEEFEKARAATREHYIRRGPAAAKLLKLMDEPESFYEHNLTNALLWRAYCEQVIKPSITVTDEEARKAQLAQSEWNDAAEATNAFKCAQIREILAKLKPSDGTEPMDFGEAAEKWSECETAETKGVFMEDDDNVQKLVKDDLREEIEAAYAKLEEGETSGIVETPFSWHILKLLKRHPETDEDEASVELAHIMLEKTPLKPELSLEEARERLVAVRTKIELAKRFVDLFAKTEIKCPIPLKDGQDGATGPKVRIRRVR